ncbi:hypothetical protein [Streptomyces griseus]|uniref:hypothetical protein n=1 Tax=Streptomyces griseus TaxID=1911 RepID=UPI001CEF585F|nr:hypothetical protein [Streptomyces griseus]
MDAERGAAQSVFAVHASDSRSSGSLVKHWVSVDFCSSWSVCSSCSRVLSASWSSVALNSWRVGRGKTS